MAFCRVYEGWISEKAKEQQSDLTMRTPLRAPNQMTNDQHQLNTTDIHRCLRSFILNASRPIMRDLNYKSRLRVKTFHEAWSQGRNWVPVHTKKPQQVWCPINLRHWRVWVVRQDFCVLRPLKLVEELCAQHNVEVLADASNHFIHSVFPKQNQH